MLFDMLTVAGIFYFFFTCNPWLLYTSRPQDVPIFAERSLHGAGFLWRAMWKKNAIFMEYALLSKTSQSGILCLMNTSLTWYKHTWQPSAHIAQLRKLHMRPRRTLLHPNLVTTLGLMWLILLAFQKRHNSWIGMIDNKGIECKNIGNRSFLSWLVDPSGVLCNSIRLWLS